MTEQVAGATSVRPSQAVYSARWRARHPERVKATYAKYRASSRAVVQRRIDATRELIDSLKAHPCTRCGGSFPPECMDFDHVRGVKSRDVGAMLGARPESILAEVAKCDLVCSNCHRTITRQRRMGVLV